MPRARMDPSLRSLAPMRINASWFGLHWPTEYKYVGASVCVRRQAPLGYGDQCFGPIARVSLSVIRLFDGLARSSKVDQDGHDLQHSVSRQSAAVLDVVKARPGNGRACLDVGATAGLDDICARRRGLIHGRGGRMLAARSNKSMGNREGEERRSRAALIPLTTKAPYKSSARKGIANRLGPE